MPSRLLQACVYALATFACVACWTSALPTWAAWLASIAIWIHAARIMRGQGALAPGTVCLDDGGDVALNFSGSTQSLTGVALRFRGPLAVLTGTDSTGTMRRLLWWPDTLPAASRRQLHLIAGRWRATSVSPLPPEY